MAQKQSPRISVIDPISPTFDRVKIMLFKPFDLAKWFIIGFCAWLAYLGSGGGGGGEPRFNVPAKDHGQDLQISQALDQAKEFILNNLYWVIPAAVVGLTIMIILWLVITWLSSRGRFMFLHCVAQNKAEVKNPWKKFKHHANSLFLFRIILGVIGFVVVGLPVLGLVFLILITISRTGLLTASVLGFVVIGIIIAAISIVLFLVKKFTMDFVVPIMFLRTASCITAWRQFWALFSNNLARFALYLLFQIVIFIAICAILMAAALVTCCCAACIFSIPYIGTVAMLPLFVFKRAYSLYYLQQFGPDFDVFTPEAAPQP